MDDRDERAYVRGSPPDPWLERANERAPVLLRAFAVAVQIAAIVATVLLPEILQLPLICGFVVLSIADAATFVRFCVRIRQIRLQHHRDVQLAADKNAREGELLRLATFAVGTAHEIGTPLSTMAVVVGDLRQRDTPPPDWKESVEVLWQQIQACKHSLSGLAETSDPPGAGRSRDILAGELVRSLMERIHLLRPEVSVQLRSMRADPDLLVKADLTLAQALLNLVDNAVDVSPRQVELRTAQHDAKFVIEILDRGPGISPAVRERLGEAFVTGKEPGHGCGIGVFLARNAIERLGGTVTMLDRADGGTRVQVVLPAFHKGGQESTVHPVMNE